MHPNSITTIPGRVSLTVDIRDVDSDRQRQLAVEVARRARAIAERRKVGATVEVIADTSPVVLPIWIRGVTSSVCAELGYTYKVMTSGAGHDAAGHQRRDARRHGLRAQPGGPQPRPRRMDERVGHRPRRRSPAALRRAPRRPGRVARDAVGGRPRPDRGRGCWRRGGRPAPAGPSGACRPTDADAGPGLGRDRQPRRRRRPSTCGWCSTRRPSRRPSNRGSS